MNFIFFIAKGICFKCLYTQKEDTVLLNAHNQTVKAICQDIGFSYLYYQDPWHIYLVFSFN